MAHSKTLSGSMDRRQILRAGSGLAATGLLAHSGAARAADPIRVGVLVDMSGPFSDYSGPTSVTAAQMAAAEIGQVLGRPVEIVSADHQNKPDIASAIAREWFDQRGVLAIADLTSSAVALAVQSLAAERKKITLNAGPATAALINENCSKTGFMWVHDTYSQSAGPSRKLVEQGLKNWFLIVTDYAYGHQMQSDLTRSLAAAGGKVMGSVRHPVATMDFSSFLLQAQASGAQVVGMINAGSDTINCVKQAAEFGLTLKQKFFLPGAVISDVHSLGLQQAQGLLLMNSFYWDRNDESRAWARSFFEKTKRMPDQIQVGTYSAVRHFLKSVQAAGSTDGPTVAEAMRATRVNDIYVKDAEIRADGRLAHEGYIVTVKTPAESKAPWDYYHQTGVVSVEQALQPLSESRCSFAKS